MTNMASERIDVGGQVGFSVSILESLDGYPSNGRCSTGQRGRQFAVPGGESGLSLALNSPLVLSRES